MQQSPTGLAGMAMVTMTSTSTVIPISRVGIQISVVVINGNLVEVGLVLEIVRERDPVREIGRERDLMLGHGQGQGLMLGHGQGQDRVRDKGLAQVKNLVLAKDPA